MKRTEKIQRLIGLLLTDEPEYRSLTQNFSHDEESQRRLLRSLMNVRVPGKPLPEEYFQLQDQLLQEEASERGIVHTADLEPAGTDPRLVLWQGDITRLDADAIVNAANSQLLGCFVPCHSCIDNAIHSAAGLQLRDACAELMNAQGYEEPTGRAKATKGYNLPAKYVLHTVGPIVAGSVTPEDKTLLADCYRSCLDLADSLHLKSIAFCCISTGVFHFPNDLAASIAVGTVRTWLGSHPDTSVGRVIFNVFKDLDRELYRNCLSG